MLRVIEAHCFCRRSSGTVVGSGSFHFFVAHNAPSPLIIGDFLLCSLSVDIERQLKARELRVEPAVERVLASRHK